MNNYLLLFLLGLGAGAWFWLDSMRAREIATGICAEYCRSRGLQFLDQTVALKKLRLRRDASGRLRVCRTYGFEFTDSGAVRYPGEAVMLGPRLAELRLAEFSSPPQ
jgi:hypothetical protein